MKHLPTEITEKRRHSIVIPRSFTNESIINKRPSQLFNYEVLITAGCTNFHHNTLR